MVIVDLLLWWYTTGWLTLVRRCGTRIQSVLGFFSVPLLLTSLFAPFRQISAGHVQGSLNAQLQAFGDRLFSRFIGAIIRLMLILIGLIILVVLAVLCGIAIGMWPLLPIAPLIGLLLNGVGIHG